MSEQDARCGDAAARAAVGSRPASIRDVAHLAGVSMQTVSRVTTGNGPVSALSRSRVEEAMRTLGYRPNRVARALRSGRSHMVGLMVDYLETFGSRQMLNSVLRAASSRGYGLTLIPRELDGRLRQSAPFVAGLDLDGLIVNAGGALSEQVADLFPEVPVVALGTVVKPAADWSSVDMDQGLISRIAVEHLIGLGHRAIAHVGGDSDDPVATARAEGYERAMRAHGLEPLTVDYAGWWAADGYLAGERIVGHCPRCTAVYAANDTLAMGVIQALRARGIDVPGRISVVGVDDSVGGYYAVNELTTVRQRYDEVAGTVMDILDAAIRGERDVRRVRVESELVVRSTTASVRSCVDGR